MADFIERRETNTFCECFVSVAERRWIAVDIRLKKVRLGIRASDRLKPPKEAELLIQSYVESITAVRL